MNNTTVRSILFVPADSERKIEKSTTSGADAVVLDLEDSVSQSRLGYARDLVADYLQNKFDRNPQKIWVRVNPLNSAFILDDLTSVIKGAPDAVLLPKCFSGQDVHVLDNYLTILERREGVSDGHIQIVPVATETPQAMFGLDSYRNCSARLLGLTWGAEDLSSAVGASTNKDSDGRLSFTYQLARSLCLLGSKSANALAIDGIFADFRDSEGLRTEVAQSRKDGFNAKFAIHPAQIEIINEGFLPDEAEIQHARAVVEAFATQEGQGAVQLDKVMLDRPHLTQAKRILAIIGE